MTESDDSQLNNLQNEFKKLRVDLNGCCTSSGDLSKSEIEVFLSPPLPISPSTETQDMSPKPQKVPRSLNCKFSSKYTRMLKKVSNTVEKKKLNYLSPLLHEHGFLKNPKSHHSSLAGHHLHKNLTVCKNQQNTFDYCDSDSLHVNNRDRDCAFLPNPDVDDTTVDELAGYFETFVHIPKKMSHMAEMMYT